MSNPPNATLYIRNIDEKRPIPEVVDGLREIFEEFGDIIDVVAKKNLRAKGQAFIVFSDVEEATDAKEALQGFELFDRPIEVAFAKTKSDATIKKESGEESQAFQEHKKQRLAEKERKQAQLVAEEAAKPSKRPGDDSLAERPAKSSKPALASTADDYLPPNKILILRELPEDYGKQELTDVFSRFAGLKEIRVVPGRKGIAFAEYDDEGASAAARDSMNGAQLGDKTIRVTFQRS